MKKNILKLFILCAVFVLFFGTILFFSFSNNKNVLAVEDITGGWFWSPHIGWASQNCSNRYYGILSSDYKNYCGIERSPYLDVNFNGKDILIGESKIIDSSGNDINGIYKDNSGNKNVNVNNIKIGRSNAINGYDASFTGFDSSAIEFKDRKFDIHKSDYFFTISMWFKANPDDIQEAEAMLFSHHSSLSHSPGEQKKYYCALYKTSIAREDRIKCMLHTYSIDKTIELDDRWHNLVLVYNGKTLKLYLDGNEYGSVNTGNFNYSASGGDVTLILGNSKPGSVYENVFPGQVDDFRFWREALTLEEIQKNQFYNSNYGLTVDENGFLSGWSWSSHYGWICFGETCRDGTRPHSNINNETKIHKTTNSANGIYKDMITGWAQIINLKDHGWIALNTDRDEPVSGSTYKDCASCMSKDTETDLITYFKMDEESGDVISDYSGLQHNGRLISNNQNFSYPNGRVNNCIYLDGDDYIQVDEKYNIRDRDFSFEIWFKPNTSQEETIISSDQFNLKKTDRDIKFEFMEVGDSLSREYELRTNEWYHLLISVKRNDDKISVFLYVNGSVVAHSDMNGYDNLKIGNLRIGGSQGDGSNNFFGSIDIFRLYTRIFSEEDALYNYKYPEKRLCSGCFHIFLDENKNTKRHICYDCKKCSISEDATYSYNCDSCAKCKKYGLIFDSNESNIKGFAWNGPVNPLTINESGVGWIQFSPSLSAGVYQSYVSGKYGNIYSRTNIGSESSVAPPVGRYNATYLIQANGDITNWISEQMIITGDSGNISGYDYSSNWINRGVDYEFPSSDNSYGNILGSLDYDGIIGGEYGNVIERLPTPGECLNGRIYKKTDDVTIEDPYIFQDGQCSNTSGVIVIEGRLTINKDITYSSPSISQVKQLSSVVWIIKGDLIINPNVTNLAGTFIVLGKDGVECGDNMSHLERNCGAIYTGSSNKQLLVSGQFLAKAFKFERTYKSDFREPAELIIYDGRNIVNPPPGLGDVLKSFPRWDQIAPY
jgi:hypothetical protein